MMNLPIPFLKLSMPILGSTLLLFADRVLAQISPSQSNPEQGLQSTISNVLLGGVVVLLAWSLINTRRAEKKVEKVITVLEGWNGKSGMIQELHELTKKNANLSIEISKLWGKINHLRKTGVVTSREEDGE